jgi:hypothetical protein
MLKVEWSDLEQYCPSYADIGARDKVAGALVMS